VPQYFLQAASRSPHAYSWPEPYIHTVYDCIFGDFPAKNAVYAPYIYGSGQPYTRTTGHNTTRLRSACLSLLAPQTTRSFSTPLAKCPFFNVLLAPQATRSLSTPLASAFPAQVLPYFLSWWGRTGHQVGIVTCCQIKLSSLQSVGLSTTTNILPTQSCTTLICHVSASSADCKLSSLYWWERYQEKGRKAYADAIQCWWWALCYLLACLLCRVDQNRIYTYIYTVYLVIFKPKIPYVHRICMVLANPTIMPCAGAGRSGYSHYC
jgi:hypothetical protein